LIYQGKGYDNPARESSNMKFSDYFSIFAVLISALSLYLSWRQYSRDRSHLKLGLKITREDIRKGPAFVVSVVNVGRRPATVPHGFAQVSSGKRYPVYDTPIVLEETKGFEFSVYFFDFFRSLSSGSFITAFVMEDSAGKRYSISTRPLKIQIKKCLLVTNPPALKED
jgi:hypothetical protein